jgi:hypothetical protein
MLMARLASINQHKVVQIRTSKTPISQFNFLFFCQSLSIGDCDSDHELFPDFLRRLESTLSASPAQPALQAEVLTCLEQCLLGDAARAALSHWRQMYRAHFISSAKLLQSLGENLIIINPEILGRQKNYISRFRYDTQTILADFHLAIGYPMPTLHKPV